MNQNDYEAMVENLTDEFVEMVRALVDVIAPSGPWWADTASPEEQVIRWLEMRDAAMSWLQAAEPYMQGIWEPSDGPGTRYKKLFLHPNPFALMPPELLVAVPKEVKQAFRYAGLDQAGRFMDNAERNAGPLARAIIGAMSPQAPASLPQGVLLREMQDELPTAG